MLKEKAKRDREKEKELKRIINNMIFTEKDSMILNKKKLNLLYLKLKSLKARVKHTKKEIRKFKEDNRIPGY